MCDLFSAIVLKNGEVIPCEYFGNEKKFSHTEQLIKLGIKDDTNNPDEMKFARIEINPPNGDIFNQEYDKWIFKIDQTITPKWWTKVDEKNCYKSLKANIGSYMMINKDIKELKDCNIFAIKNCAIEKLSGSAKIGSVYGSAKIGSVYDSAKIGYVYGSAKIGSVYDSANIGYVSGSAKIGYVYGSANIGSVSDSANIGYVYGSAKIGYVYGSANIGYVSGSAKIGSVYDSAKIGSVYGSAKIGSVYDSANIGSVSGSAKIGSVYDSAIININDKDVIFKVKNNGLAIIRYKDNIEIVHSKKNKVKLIKQKGAKK